MAAIQSFNGNDGGNHDRINKSKNDEVTEGQQLGDVHCGTAGYSYAHWRKDVFYPSHIVQSQELRHYSGVFSAVEINASFHAVPRKETLENWDKTAKAGFLFSFKVPQQITHEQRLEQIEESLRYFLDRLLTIRQRLGPILFQLPPSLSQDIKKLDKIRKLIDTSYDSETIKYLKVAFEFRNKSWYCPEVYQVMKQHNFGICENMSPDESTIRYRGTTADTWHYIRFHKQGTDRLETNYSDEQLAIAADQLVERRKRGVHQFCFFLNDYGGNGPRNAKTLLKFVKERSDKQPFVKMTSWKPDPATPSISSLFSKGRNASTTTIQKSTAIAKSMDSAAAKIGVQKPLTPSKKRTIESFFANTSAMTPSLPIDKRPRLPSSNNTKPLQKGEITSFFTPK